MMYYDIAHIAAIVQYVHLYLYNNTIGHTIFSLPTL